jgi:lysozyme family protein
MSLPIYFIDCVDLVIKDEGGYVNDPDDAGGETKYGISKRAYPRENIKELSIDRARSIYRNDYWEKAHCQEIPEEIRYIHFDTGINMGLRMALKLLQRAGGIKDDGLWGKDTLAASQNVTLERYADERILQYNDIVKQNPKNAKFLNGWTKRVNRIVALKDPIA